MYTPASATTKKETGESPMTHQHEALLQQFGQPGLRLLQAAQGIAIAASRSTITTAELFVAASFDTEVASRLRMTPVIAQAFFGYQAQKAYGGPDTFPLERYTPGAMETLEVAVAQAKENNFGGGVRPIDVFLALLLVCDEDVQAVLDRLEKAGFSLQQSTLAVS